MDARYVTVVTGAAGGIGYAVVRQLRAAGRLVAAVDRDAAPLRERFADDAAVTCLACDLTTEEGFQYLTTTLKASFAGVEGFVHAAGFDLVAPLGMIKPDAIARLVEIHANFPVRFLGWLSRKPNRAPRASCVLVSSLSAHEGAKSHVAYAAAKGAVEGMLRPAAAELVDKGVRVNAVVLGVVETEMAKRWLTKLLPEQYKAITDSYPLGLGKPEKVAEVICFLLGDASSWITGQTLVCDGGHSIA